MSFRIPCLSSTVGPLRHMDQCWGQSKRYRRYYLHFFEGWRVLAVCARRKFIPHNCMFDWKCDGNFSQNSSTEILRPHVLVNVPGWYITAWPVSLENYNAWETRAALGSTQFTSAYKWVSDFWWPFSKGTLSRNIPAMDEYGLDYYLACFPENQNLFHCIKLTRSGDLFASVLRQSEIEK